MSEQINIKIVDGADKDRNVTFLIKFSPSHSIEWKIVRSEFDKNPDAAWAAAKAWANNSPRTTHRSRLICIEEINPKEQP